MLCENVLIDNRGGFALRWLLQPAGGDRSLPMMDDFKKS